MKRIISIVTLAAILMSLTFAVPVSAADPKVDLKQAIEIAKKTFDIDSQSYDFNSNYSETNTGQRLWSLNWNAKQANGGGIGVTVDADTGEIVNMNSWEPYYGPAGRIPKYSKPDALKVAEELAKRLQPEKFKQTRLYESTQDKLNLNYYTDMYTFNFIRQANGIDFYDNSISVSVDKNTLKVRYFSVNWDREALPDAKNTISLEQAKKVFEEKLGLELSYYMVYPEQGQEPKPILVYTFKNGNGPIDAFTGELLNNYWYGGMKAMDEAAARGVAGSSSYTVLTPQEQKVVDDTGSYITKEQALESFQRLVDVTGDYKLINASLFGGYMNENAAWSFSWEKVDKDKNLYGYISGSVDAVTGEVKNFYISENDTGYGKDEKPNFTKEQCRDAAEKFLESFQPEKLKSSEYRENQYETFSGLDKPLTYNFNYIRKINGASAPFNAMNVTVSTRTGKVMGFNMNWSNMTFPEVKNTIGLEEAYKVLYSKADLALRYIRLYDYRNSGDMPAVKLAYQINDFYGLIDATTGAQIDYNGKPVTEAKQAAFTDIQGHAAESDIKLLAEIGVIEAAGDKFNPGGSILQKDFIKLLVRAIQPVYYPVYRTEGGSDYDYYYDQAIQQRILRAEDKKPEATVARQEAAKMLVKALGVGFVADLGGIYNIGFTDADAVTPAYRGYIAIASELGIIAPVDNAFEPAKLVSRGDAASMLVRLLKVDTTQGDSGSGIIIPLER